MAVAKFLSEAFNLNLNSKLAKMFIFPGLFTSRTFQTSGCSVYLTLPVIKVLLMLIQSYEIFDQSLIECIG